MVPADSLITTKATRSRPKDSRVLCAGQIERAATLAPRVRSVWTFAIAHLPQVARPQDPEIGMGHLLDATAAYDPCANLRGIAVEHLHRRVVGRLPASSSRVMHAKC